MKTSSFRIRRRWLTTIGRRAVLAAGLLIALPVVAPPAHAADDDSYGNSLDWVPASATVYSSSLRVKQQIDAIAESNAWKKFLEIPSIAMGWQMAEMQINNPEGPAAMFWQLMELPENKQLAKMLGEMFSDEIVFYAGEDFPKFVELMSVLQGSRVAPMIEAMDIGGGEFVDPNEARIRAVAEAIEADPELLTTPEMVMAFKVKDADAAETQLKRLEVVANMAIQQSKAEVELEREEIGDVEYLVLNLDGSMIPWPAEAPANMPIDEETYESLKEIVSEKEVSVALGVWNNYVILSFGESTDHLAELGDEDLLVETDDFAPLLPHLEEEEGDLVGVSYISAAVMKHQALTPQDLDDTAEALDDAIENSDGIDDELKGELSEDLVEFADDMKPYLPKPGAIASCTLDTDAGFESYTYNWAENTRLDGSLPLELTNHLGGSPIIAVVGRGVHDPNAYALLAKWVGKGIGYFEGYGLAEMDEEDREQAKKALELVKPLLARIDKTTREHLIPALKDGQTALVIDADIKSNQWQKEMPKSYAELPMVELAIVVGVSDAAELKTAAKEYWAIAKDAVEVVRELDDEESIPEDFELPNPAKTETSDGAVYAWALPSDAEVDDQIALAVSIGKHVAAVASSPALAERVLAESAWKDLPVGDVEEPRAVVAGINFASLIDASAPWIDYAIRVNLAGEEAAASDPDEDDSQAAEICSQVKSGLEILKCFRGAWSETVKEDGVWMTHTVTVFEDIKE